MSARRVSFVLPGWTGAPSGGYLVAHERASRLTAHRVRMVHVDSMRRWTTRRYVRSRFQPDRGALPMHPRVEHHRRWRLPTRALRGEDCIVVTSWRTAEAVRAAGIPPSRVVYLLQGWETWSGPRARVEATLRAGFTIAAVSAWLADLAIRAGARNVTVVPNGVDTEVFHPPCCPMDRKGLTLVWSPDEPKGGDLALTLLDEIGARHPDIPRTLVTASAEQPRTSAQIVRRPSRTELGELLRRSAVFVSTSRSEGFGLPGLEAMACGTALVTTDSGGPRDYAVDGVNALVTPVEAEALIDATCRVLADAELAAALGSRGAAVAASMTWEASMPLFEGLLA